MKGGDPFGDARRWRPRRTGGTLGVVLGDQLDRDSALLERLDPDRDVVLMAEVEEESRHVASHKQRTVLFLSAMRHFALWLEERGFAVRYVKLDDDGNTGTLTGEVKRAVSAQEAERVLVVEPGEHRVRAMAEGWGSGVSGGVEILEDGHFLASHERFGEWAEGRKQLTLEYFYREERRRLGVLIEGEKDPVGGKWNFDKENRASFKKTPRTPRIYFAQSDGVTEGVIEMVGRRLGDLPGKLDHFRWPVTREQARRGLEKFIEERLPRFGTYQDAMWTEQPFLYHAVLSPTFNLKLLGPMEAVEAAVEAYEGGHAPLNAVEGFVRQLIGWREFIRGVYWHEGAGYVGRNGLDQHGSLPGLYWTGETEMACLRDCVGQVLEHGYGHHIQRLMVTGNFALIAGVDPREVSDWYLGMYVDGVDWVTAPNTLGMAMHADGGVVGTKPYASSGQYIKRMSNYCDGCRYDPSKRTGEDACPFTTFYWDFLNRNEERFRGNNRMNMILKNLERIGKREMTEITVRGERLRDELGIGSIEED